MDFFIYIINYIMIIEMTKIYPTSVIEKADEIIEILKEEGFFEYNEIDNFDFASKHIKDKLTEKFILGTLDDEEEMFTEEEFETLLKEIIAGTVLEELKSKGLVGSYEDEDTEEMFFLTPKGKKYLKNID
jgi:hypothetical protein